MLASWSAGSLCVEITRQAPRQQSWYRSSNFSISSREML
jgi:hypothetical protein